MKDCRQHRVGPLATRWEGFVSLVTCAGLLALAGCQGQTSPPSGAESGGQTPEAAEATQGDAQGDTRAEGAQGGDAQAQAPAADSSGGQADAEPDAQDQVQDQAQAQTQADGDGEGFAELGVEDLVVGDGELAEPDSTVTVHYRGTLASDGSEFDASAPGEPVTFPLRNLIVGWQEGIPGMRVGGTRRLEVPWSMAYGERGRPPAIPPKADLVFEIELEDVKNPRSLATEFEGEPVDLGDGLLIREVEPGAGRGEVKPGATVVAHYLGVLAEDGTVFDSSYERGQPATLRLDEVIAGFSRGLVGMQAGGVRRLEVPAALGYGEQGSPPAIPGNADLIFQVELLSFRNPRELSESWQSERTLDNGLVVRVIEQGEGEPLPAEGVMTVHTLGVLEDGTRFTSTWAEGTPQTMPLDVAIEGWQQGLVGMRPGGVRQLVVPPGLAFGEEGREPSIPGGATLTFEIELVEWRAPRSFSAEFAGEARTIAEGVVVRDVTVGDGPVIEEGQQAIVHYIASLEDGEKIVDTFAVNDIQVVPLDENPPVPGLKRGIVGMRVGGVRRIELAADQAFGAEGRPPVIPPDSPMVFEVELLGVR